MSNEIINSANKMAILFMTNLARQHFDERESYKQKLTDNTTSSLNYQIGVKKRVPKELIVDCIEKYGYVEMSIDKLIEIDTQVRRQNK